MTKKEIMRIGMELAYRYKGLWETENYSGDDGKAQYYHGAWYGIVLLLSKITGTSISSIIDRLNDQ